MPGSLYAWRRAEALEATGTDPVLVPVPGARGTGLPRTAPRAAVAVLDAVAAGAAWWWAGILVRYG